MRKRWVLAAVVAATVAGSFGATSAGADGPTQANAIGKVRIDPNDPTIAYIKAEYRCHGEGALWISVKQTADRSKDPALAEEGSSGISAAWSMSHRNPVTCDGKTHVQTFVVDQVETSMFGVPRRPLVNGFGYVQFCLFDDNYPGDSAPYSDNGFMRVR
jgi:hypothetical protein